MRSNGIDDRLVSAETGGIEIGVKPDTLRRWARDGHIPSFKVRGALRFRLSDLKALVVPRPAGKQKARG
ncbi:MAG: helix-turn-helix domain-containing protein [Deltaproteobacteria bacterium]|nr:helix-turn-helix domain-containing protein [Deltaproteobacteria bacterium]